MRETVRVAAAGVALGERLGLVDTEREYVELGERDEVGERDEDTVRDGLCDPLGEVEGEGEDEGDPPPPHRTATIVPDMVGEIEKVPVTLPDTPGERERVGDAEGLLVLLVLLVRVEVEALEVEVFPLALGEGETEGDRVKREESEFVEDVEMERVGEMEREGEVQVLGVAEGEFDREGEEETLCERCALGEREETHTGDGVVEDVAVVRRRETVG